MKVKQHDWVFSVVLSAWVDIREGERRGRLSSYVRDVVFALRLCTV